MSKAAMESSIGGDCWKVVLGMLDSNSVCQVYAVSHFFRKQVLQFRKAHLTFALVDQRHRNGGCCPVPGFVRALHSPDMEWCTRWSDGVGFRPASALLRQPAAAVVLDAAGWNCSRPLHPLERQMMAELVASDLTVTTFRLVDQRSNWSFWDSLSLHPALTELLFVHCKALRHIHLEHLCLTALFSLQRAPASTNGDCNNQNSALQKWVLPDLLSLRLMDTKLDLALLQLIGTLAPNLRFLHVHSIAVDVTKEALHDFLQRTKSLQHIRVGYSFHRGIRTNREVQCTSCAVGGPEERAPRHASNGSDCWTYAHSSVHSSGTGTRTFDICLRERVQEFTCAALLKACSSVGIIRSLHIFGLDDDSENSTVNADDESEDLLDDIFVATLAGCDRSGGLQHLHIGAAVQLSAQHLAAICQNCHGLQRLTLKTRFEDEDLEVISSNLTRLRTLNIVINRPRHKTGPQTLSEAGLANLVQLSSLQELHLNLHGTAFPLHWYSRHLGTTENISDDSAAVTFEECASSKPTEVVAPLHQDQQPPGEYEQGGGELAGELPDGFSPETAQIGAPATQRWTSKGLASLQKCLSLQRVFIGGLLFAGLSLGGAGCGGGGGSKSGFRNKDEGTPPPHPLDRISKFDDSEFEEKAGERLLSLAEWAREYRRTGLEQLAQSTSGRCCKRDDSFNSF